MQLDHLAVEILKKVAIEPGMPLKTLCERIGLPLRNFYYRRTRINDWLAAEGLSPLDCDAHSGVRLSEDDAKKVLAKLSEIHIRFYRYSADERRDNILLHLACRTQPAFTQHFSELNRVSRNTTLDDLRSLKQQLQHHNLNLSVSKKHGYFIEGSDLALRLAIQQMFQHALKYADHQAEHRIMQTLFTHLQRVGLDIEDICLIVDRELSHAEQRIEWAFSDKDKRLLRYMIMFSLVDTLTGNIPHFTPAQSQFLRDQLACEVAASLNASLSQRIGLQAVSGNTMFFTLLFSASKRLIPNHISIENDVRLLRAVRQLIIQFQALSGVYLQESEQLESQLFSHLGPAIHRCLFGMPSENAMREEILVRYPLLFRLCRRIIVSFEQEYQIIFCDDELSYVVISFAAWMDRRPETSEQHLLLVTEGGLSSTAILENQLRNLTILPLHIERVSASQLQQQDVGEHVRLVVSTIALDIPLPAHVRFIQTLHMLSENDKQQLRLMLEHNIEATEISQLTETLVASVNRLAPQLKAALHHEFSTIISQFMQKRQHRTLALAPTVNSRALFVNFTSSRSSWRQLIRKAAKPLRDNEIIDEKYVRNIVNNIEREGITTYLTPDILLLHDAPPSGVTEGALSVLKLKSPLSFDLPGVMFMPRIIVILVPTKNLSHISLLETFNRLISDDDRLERLLNAGSLQAVNAVFTSID